MKPSTPIPMIKFYGPAGRRLALALLCALCVTSFRAAAQPSVTQVTNATTLAQTLAGAGVIVSNATLSCVSTGSGIFNATGTSLPISNGILLSTGIVDSLFTTSDYFNSGGGFGFPQFDSADADLNNLIVGGLDGHDKCALEFDVFVTADTLRFNYVFGSEEYNDWVNTSFNDVFGFFISGPGIVGSQNIALLPGTSTPVSINNVNCGNNGVDYLCNTANENTLGNCTASDCPSSNAATTVSYDGMTVELTAQAIVIPCQSYHLKLAIEDAGDGSYDSGVFIETGSLTAVGVQVTPSATYVNPFTNGPTAVEGCVDGQVKIRLSFLPIDTVQIPLQVAGTAQYGVDYTYSGFGSDTLTFLPGDSVALINIQPVDDGIAEPFETIYFIYQPQFCSTSPFDTAVIYIADLLAAETSPDDTICIGTSAQLSVSGGSSITYNWSPSSGLSCTDCQSPVATPTVTTTYTVTISASSGCTATDTVVVTVVDPTANIGPDVNLCAGDSVTLYATPTPVNGLSYDWSPGTGLSCTDCYATVASPDVTTTYYLHTHAGTCDAYDTIVVNVVFPVANAGPDVNLCFGDSIQLQTTAQNGQTYLWNPFINATHPDSAITLVYPDTTTTYTVTATMGSCFAQDSVVVNVTHVFPNAGPDVGICPGTSTTLIGSGGAVFLWQPATGLDNPTNDTVVAGPAVTTTYVLTVASTGFVCTASDTMVLTVYPGPVAVVPADTTICYETLAYLYGSGGETYDWTPLDKVTNPEGQTTFANPLDTTMYTLVVTDANACKDTAYVTVNVYPEPDLPVSDPQYIYYGESVTLEAGGGESYSWTPDSTLQLENTANPIATPSFSTTYTVLITTENGCLYEREVPVIVDRTSFVLAPNAFSPNGDGINDEFKIIVRGVFQLKNFQIFDRWGESVFESDNADQGWDGTVDGEKAPIGVYVYKILGVDINNRSILKTGNLVLLR